MKANQLWHIIAKDNQGVILAHWEIAAANKSAARHRLTRHWDKTTREYFILAQMDHAFRLYFQRKGAEK